MLLDVCESLLYCTDDHQLSIGVRLDHAGISIKSHFYIAAVGENLYKCGKNVLNGLHDASLLMESANRGA